MILRSSKILLMIFSIISHHTKENHICMSNGINKFSVSFVANQVEEDLLMVLCRCQCALALHCLEPLRSSLDRWQTMDNNQIAIRLALIDGNVWWFCRQKDVVCIRLVVPSSFSICSYPMKSFLLVDDQKHLSFDHLQTNPLTLTLELWPFYSHKTTWNPQMFPIRCLASEPYYRDQYVFVYLHQIWLPAWNSMWCRPCGSWSALMPHPMVHSTVVRCKGWNQCALSPNCHECRMNSIGRESCPLWIYARLVMGTIFLVVLASPLFAHDIFLLESAHFWIVCIATNA